jgi:hypothetical protein
MNGTVTFIEQLRDGNANYKLILSDPEHLDDLVVLYIAINQKGGADMIESDPLPTQEEMDIRAEFEREKKGTI